MGLLDKVKNMFTEEVENDEVRVEPVKREVTHVSIESPSSKPKDTSTMVRRNTHTVPDNFGDDIFDISPKEEEKVNKPVFFDEKDFKELDLVTKQEDKKPVRKEKEIYGSKLSLEKEVEEKKIFKPTPIISPVYGVLDKNYHKEDIIAREQNTLRPTIVSSEPSIDSIRNKAYGTLEDELENTLFGTNSVLLKNDEEEKTEEVKPIEDIFPEEIEEVEEVKAKEKLERLEELERKEIPKSKFSSSNSNDDILSDLTNDLTRELDELLNMKERMSKQQSKSSYSKPSEKGFDNYETDDINEDDLLGFIDSTLYKGDDE